MENRFKLIIPLLIIVLASSWMVFIPVAGHARYQIRQEFQYAEPSEDPHLSIDPELSKLAGEDVNLSSLSHHLRLMALRVMIMLS
ncbi:MAG: hypothetical protein GF417_11400 [Candidatus Latescibacteria bacterium]|nr:hypothetical protein [bacterium]MBD3425029.1 hypothetical protein [Candidatus Latescibacterota bacterium]